MSITIIELSDFLNPLAVAQPGEYPSSSNTCPIINIALRLSAEGIGNVMSLAKLSIMRPWTVFFHLAKK